MTMKIKEAKILKMDKARRFDYQRSLDSRENLSTSNILGIELYYYPMNFRTKSENC